jgi:membrane-bound lytic murein transglycosylase A
MATLAACTTSTKTAPDQSPEPAALTSAAALPRFIIPLTLPAAMDMRSLAAFRAACPAIRTRTDRSGLTHVQDWATPCDAAQTAIDPATFFASHFTAVRLADGKGFATGYFEPEIAASRTRTAEYATPLYKRPPDLVEADLGAFRPDWQGRTLRGQLKGNKITPYPPRAAIANGALAGQNLELAYAADANAAFFLEIQGSGRLRLPDGSIMRIGYASQNGRDYVAIGRVLKDQGKLTSPITMASILDWLRTHPDEAPAIRAANPSQIFFRELTGLAPEQGPIGALGHPLTPQVSAAVDPAFTPYGAPLLIIRPDQPPELQIAADTGGAIRGPGRIDMFRGPSRLDARLDSGTAASEAGALASPIDITLLLPHAAAARLQSEAP